MEKNLNRRSLLQSAAALAAGGALGFNAAQSLAAGRSPILVELFTSQGCSSCPPADVLAGELAKRDDLIVVSLNVDYWDYLGWKDTLARPEFTKRQRDYAKARGDGDVYTPQMVVNGEFHAVGSRKSQVQGKINEVASAISIPLTVELGKADVRVSVGAGDVGEATLWLMSVANDVSVEIGRGENAGSTVTYRNVVRSLTPMGMYKGEAAKFAMPRQAVLAPDAKFVLAVLQRDMVGQVIGLSKVPVVAV